MYVCVCVCVYARVLQGDDEGIRQMTDDTGTDFRERANQHMRELTAVFDEFAEMMQVRGMPYKRTRALWALKAHVSLQLLLVHSVRLVWLSMFVLLTGE